MNRLRLILDAQAVDGYLEEHGLAEGFAPIDAVLLQLMGTEAGEPCAMIVIDVEGKKRLAKTTLSLLEKGAHALRDAVERATGKPGAKPSDHVWMVAELMRRSFKQTDEHTLKWLCEPHSELGGLAPINVIARGQGEIVVAMLQAAAWGIPS